VVWGPGDVSMDNIVMTEMYCPDSEETEFVSTLSRTTAYEVKGDTLTLTIEGDIAGYDYMIFNKI
jgi:heat shock protein HslJ